VCGLVLTDQNEGVSWKVGGVQVLVCGAVASQNAFRFVCSSRSKPRGVAQTDVPKPAYDLTLPREERIKQRRARLPRDLGHATVYLLEQTAT